jgi:hypothetical protein
MTCFSLSCLCFYDEISRNAPFSSMLANSKGARSTYRSAPTPRKQITSFDISNDVDINLQDENVALNKLTELVYPLIISYFGLCTMGSLTQAQQRQYDRAEENVVHVLKFRLHPCVELVRRRLRPLFNVSRYWWKSDRLNDEEIARYSEIQSRLPKPTPAELESFKEGLRNNGISEEIIAGAELNHEASQLFKMNMEV